MTEYKILQNRNKQSELIEIVDTLVKLILEASLQET